MNRYSGAIGIRKPAVQTSPGIFEVVVEEILVTGNIYRKPIRWSAGEAAQDTLQMNQVVSVIAPESVQTKLDDIIYVTYQGIKWTVRSIEYSRPRLDLSLGGKYHA
jgi:hypothetical protein